MAYSPVFLILLQPHLGFGMEIHVTGYKESDNRCNVSGDMNNGLCVFEQRFRADILEAGSTC